ncbi:hypothetical protein WMF37_25290 [Sorangium sp. So ce291]|uniref:hypothetical protein n=1 Tax=Sorangium sp. So ce291 TaxID=3133294 RepID=UPI003F60220C
MRTRLAISVADITAGGGIDIWVEGNGWGQVPVAMNLGASHDEIGVAALCLGLMFPLKDPMNMATSIGEVSFYLDDP